MSPRLLHYRTRMTLSPLFQMAKLRQFTYTAPKDTWPVLPRGRGTGDGPWTRPSTSGDWCFTLSALASGGDPFKHT